MRTAIREATAATKDRRQYMCNSSNQYGKSIPGTAVPALMVYQPQSAKERKLWTQPRHRLYKYQQHPATINIHTRINCRDSDITQPCQPYLYIYRDQQETEGSGTAVPRSANQKPLALPRRGQRNRASYPLLLYIDSGQRRHTTTPQSRQQRHTQPRAATQSRSGTATPEIVVYQHRSGKQQPIARAGDCHKSVEISEATAMTVVSSTAVYQQRQRPATINGD